METVNKKINLSQYRKMYNNLVALRDEREEQGLSRRDDLNAEITRIAKKIKSMERIAGRSITTEKKIFYFNEEIKYLRDRRQKIISGEINDRTLRSYNLYGTRIAIIKQKIQNILLHKPENGSHAFPQHGISTKVRLV